MPRVRVRPDELIKFHLDTTQLDHDIVLVDDGLRRALPRKPNVAFLTFVSLSHGIAVGVEFHRKHGVLYAPGLQEFFREIIGSGSRAKKTCFYIGKSFDTKNTFIIATHDEIADAMGISPNHVDTFITLSHASRQRRCWADTPERDPARANRAEAFRTGAATRMSQGAARGDRARAGAAARESAEKAPPQEMPVEKPERRPREAKPREEGRSNIVDPEKMAREIIKSQLLVVPGDIVIPVVKESADEILGKLQAGLFDTPGSADVHDQALVLSANPGFDRLISLDAVRNVLPFAYQAGAVREVLRRMRGRAILADEVGLGKTVE
ncbi:MAG: hypothetical protein AB1700_18920, partial [Bacillota bacterium]